MLSFKYFGIIIQVFLLCFPSSNWFFAILEVFVASMHSFKYLVKYFPSSIWYCTFLIQIFGYYNIFQVFDIILSFMCILVNFFQEFGTVLSFKYAIL
jgi:hypothetical protein